MHYADAEPSLSVSDVEHWVVLQSEGDGGVLAVLRLVELEARRVRRGAGAAARRKFGGRAALTSDFEVLLRLGGYHGQCHHQWVLLECD